MQSTTVTSLFIFFISLWLLVSVDFVAPSNSSLVKSICNKTKTPSECVKALNRDPRTATAKDAKTLIDICLDLAVANVTICMDSVKRIQTRTTTPAAWKAALEMCYQQFNVSAGEFRMAKRELKQDAMSGSYDVMVAIDGAQMCDNIMAENKVKIPQVTSFGQNIRFFSLIGNAIIDAF